MWEQTALIFCDVKPFLDQKMPTNILQKLWFASSGLMNKPNTQARNKQQGQWAMQRNTDTCNDRNPERANKTCGLHVWGPLKGVPLWAPTVTCIEQYFPCVANCASCLVYSSTLKMEAVHSSGTSLNICQPKWHCILYKTELYTATAVKPYIQCLTTNFAMVKSFRVLALAWRKLGFITACVP
jgi:hypothetical protein